MPFQTTESVGIDDGALRRIRADGRVGSIDGQLSAFKRERRRVEMVPGNGSARMWGSRASRKGSVDSRGVRVTANRLSFRRRTK